MTLTTRVLLGLGAGLAAGIAVAASGSAVLVEAVAWIEPVGRIWVNALRMTIVPLIVAGLIVGAASAQASAIGRVGARALVVFLALLALGATFAMLAAPPLFAWLPIDDAAAAALRAGVAAPAGAAGFPDFGEWLVGLVPANPVAAAAEGAILPLIVFALAAGFAIGRIAEAERAVVTRFFRGLFDAMLMLIRWVLELAPYGVFALALPLATRLGVAAAGAVVYYIVVGAALMLAFIAALYAIVALFARVPPRRFARAAAPAQALGVSSRSSLAALPAMIDAGVKQLGFGPQITTFLLPLSASMFRAGSSIGIPVGVLFIARLYGIELAAPELATIALTSILVTFSIPGVPGGSILIMMPVMLSVGVPAEGAALLLGVDTIPDMFRTTANVTGTMTAATIVAAREPGGGSGIAAGSSADRDDARAARPAAPAHPPPARQPHDQQQTHPAAHGGPNIHES